jgi:hypothetical protein
MTAETLSRRRGIAPRHSIRPKFMTSSLLDLTRIRARDPMFSAASAVARHDDRARARLAHAAAAGVTSKGCVHDRLRRSCAKSSTGEIVRRRRAAEMTSSTRSDWIPTPKVISFTAHGQY